MPNERSKRTIIYAGIFCLAVVLRYWYLHCFSQSPLFDFPYVDEQEYDKWAREILSGKLLWDTIPYHGPVYPYILAGLYKVFGAGFFIARLFGGVISSLSCVLLGHIAWVSMGKKAGVVTGILAAVYWPLIYWSGELVVETLAVFLNLIVFLLLWRSQNDKRPWLIFVSGLFIGLSAITRPNIMFLTPFFLLWFFMTLTRRDFFRNALLLSAGMAIVILPVTLRNFIAGHEFVLIQGHGGLNLYLGLNPDIRSMYDIKPGLVWSTWMLEPVRLGLKLDSEHSHYWIGKAIMIISNEPGLFLRHMLDNALMMLSRFEIYAEKDIYYNKALCPFIYSLPGFWLAGPLGLAGAAMAFKNQREFMLHYIFLGGFFLSSIPFPVCSRHRLVMVAFLLIFAGYALVRFAEVLARKNRRMILLCLLAFSLSAALVNIDFPGVQSMVYKRTHLTLAKMYWKKHELSCARDECVKYVRAYPNDAEGYETLGDIYAAMPDYPRAERAYLKAFRIDPEYFAAANNVGAMKANQGDLAGARRYFKIAIAIYPYFEPAWNNLNRTKGQQ